MLFAPFFLSEAWMGNILLISFCYLLVPARIDLKEEVEMKGSR